MTLSKMAMQANPHNVQRISITLALYSIWLALTSKLHFAHVLLLQFYPQHVM